jgi:hypothetical protein
MTRPPANPGGFTGGGQPSTAGGSASDSVTRPCGFRRFGPGSGGSRQWSSPGQAGSSLLLLLVWCQRPPAPVLEPWGAWESSGSAQAAPLPPALAGGGGAGRRRGAPAGPGRGKGLPGTGRRKNGGVKYRGWVGRRRPRGRRRGLPLSGAVGAADGVLVHAREHAQLRRPVQAAGRPPDAAASTSPAAAPAPRGAPPACAASLPLQTAPPWRAAVPGPPRRPGCRAPRPGRRRRGRPLPARASVARSRTVRPPRELRCRGSAPHRSSSFAAARRPAAAAHPSGWFPSPSCRPPPAARHRQVGGWRSVGEGACEMDGGDSAAARDSQCSLAPSPPPCLPASLSRPGLAESRGAQ